MQTIKVSIVIKVGRNTHGTKAFNWKAYARELPSTVRTKLAELYRLLDKKIEAWAEAHKSDIGPECTKNFLCQCPECNPSIKKYFAFLKKELVWKNGHLK